jgi:DNA/RNA endonuclease G (NUC1)
VKTLPNLSERFWNICRAIYIFTPTNQPSIAPFNSAPFEPTVLASARKLLATLFVALIATSTFAWEQRAPLPVDACKVQSPYGFAATARTAQPICREAYLVAYDAPAKIPVYVAYTLLPQNALGCWPRTNAFVADKSLNGTGARPDDYAGTGYDKGHAVPDGDLSWSEIVEYESFLMTNMYPHHIQSATALVLQR